MNVSNGSASTLRERLEAQTVRAKRGYAPAWDPEDGEVLVGTLTAIDRQIATGYGVCDVAEIENEETGEAVAVWLSHTVLQNKMDRQDPSIGDRIGIAYLGRRVPENGGSSYHDYALEVEPAREDSAETTMESPVEHGA